MDAMLRDPGLTTEGRRMIQFAARRMPVLGAVTDEFRRTRPLAGVRIGACLHVTTETAALCQALVAGGAELALCASNPLSTRDDVAAAIAADLDAAVFAVHGCDRDTFYRQVQGVLATRPTVIVDDGADLTATIHASRPELLDGILRATNLLLAGKVLVVVGYGWCGRGVAGRARGMGARVVVVEVDPIKVLEAVMDGYQSLPMAEAAAIGDVFVTVTGNRDAITLDHLQAMKPGAVVCNSGHFDLEIDMAGLRRAAVEMRPVRDNVVEYVLPTGKGILVLAEGRLVGQSCAEAHPAEVMDLPSPPRH